MSISIILDIINISDWKPVDIENLSQCSNLAIDDSAMLETKMPFIINERH